MRIRLITSLSLLLTVVIIASLAKFFFDLTVKIEIVSTGEELCRPVLGIDSSEDIVVDPSDGTAYISSLWRRDPEEMEGRIYRFRINRDDQPEIVSPDLDFEFRPLGLGFLETPENRFIFAVNRLEGVGCVERFRIDANQLIHEESYCDDQFHSANDVLPLSESEFYLTNDHGSSNAFLQFVEDWTGFGRGEVRFFDGESSRRVAGGISWANGIAITQDGSRLLVSSTRSRQLLLYIRSAEDNSLDLLFVKDAQTGLDNINIDANGRFWIASHPDLLAFWQYSRDRESISPSQVIRTEILPSGEIEMGTVYLSDGDYLSGSSSAAVWRDTLLIGSVFDHRFLVCRLPED